MTRFLKIGVSRSGGLGDVLNATAYCVAIKRRFPWSTITLFSNTSHEILKNNPVIDQSVAVSSEESENPPKRFKDQFDMFFHIRYSAKIYFSDRALSDPSVLKFKEESDRRFKKYENSFYKFLDAMDELDSFNKSVYDIFYDSTGLSGSIDDMYVNLTDLQEYIPFGGTPYATLCNSAYGEIQTKCLPEYKWVEIIKHLRKNNILPVQVGRDSDKLISGAIKSGANNSIFHTARIIQKAKFNVCIEGGIAHLAKAVGTKSIVVFGPTPIKNFGYKDNINIRGSFCKPCWWRTKDWMSRCQKLDWMVSHEIPSYCMASIDNKVLIRAIDKMINQKTATLPRISVDSGYQYDPLHKETVNKLELILETALNNRNL